MLLLAAAACASTVRADIATKPIDIMGYQEPICLMESVVIEPFKILIV